jgi:hypothetical protein
VINVTVADILAAFFVHRGDKMNVNKPPDQLQSLAAWVCSGGRAS